MIKQTKSRGFTIVELLIVIVVIAILAAITIVAYNGIQNRARTSSSQSSANTIIKKAEAYNATNPGGGYPTTVANFATQQESTLAGSGVSLAAITAGTTPTTNTTVEYLPCTTPSGAGATVSYYDYTASGAATKVSRTIGATCTTSGTALAGGPF